MAVTEDFSIYFDTSTGMAVVGRYTSKIYEHESSKTVNLDGFIDNEYIEIDGVSSLRPVFLFESSKVSNPAKGDKITVKSIVYIVRVVQPDGTGATVFVLEKE